MLLAFFLFASLLLPTGILISRYGAVIEILPMLLSSAGIALLLYTLASLLKKINVTLASGLLGLLLIASLLVRFLLGFLYDFTGRGFTSEFFNHISITALNVGIFEYRKEIIFLLVVLLIIVLTAMRLNKKQAAPPNAIIITLLVAVAPLIYLGATASPELMLARAYDRYTQDSIADHSLSKSSIREQAAAMLAPLRTDSPMPIEKNQLQAGLPARPLNLILIYIESFNYMLSENARFPGLTPEINALKTRYHSFDNIYSSAYVTIEGIANSQCGTLMNMEYANNSLLTREGRLPLLPCLGDILHAAGYRQIYMGGAGLDFAGKGAFLSEHGYDELYGVKHWDKLGFERFAGWGLADTDLFEQALDTVQTLHQQPTPFNLTLLTLGMHIPGFQYEGCPRYTEDKDKQFLNAIHCTDYLLGQFIQNLEKTDVLEDTVVFVQADHGVFASTDMRKLFAKDFPDRRLLTLLAMPGKRDQARLTQNTHTLGSSVDTVASLLDILQISHNASFVFGQSHFKIDRKHEYLISRRTDYMNGQRIENEPANCVKPTQKNTITLPLDDCDKSNVMRTLRILHTSYAKVKVTHDNICELAANITLDDRTGAIVVRWGNKNLNGQFYWRGSRKRKNQINGVYAVIMDLQNNIQQALFYDKDSAQDISTLRNVLDSLNGQKVLLIRNIETTKLTTNIKALLPKVLLKNKVVYGEVKKSEIKTEFVSKNLPSKTHFIPGSCL